MDQRFTAIPWRFVTGARGELEIRANQMACRTHEPHRQGLVQRGPGARVSRLDGSGCPGLCKPAPRRIPITKKKLIVVKGRESPNHRRAGGLTPGIDRSAGSGTPRETDPLPIGDVRAKGYRLAGLQPDGERRFDVAAVGPPHRQAIAGAEHGDEVPEGSANEFLDGADVDDRGAVGTHEPGG
jgi:hypothetical protein